MPASELAGGSAHPLPGVCASPWRPFPLPCARCSVVYISSARRGAHAPRDRILSLVALAPGALHKELGEGEAQEMGTELKQGLKLGWVSAETRIRRADLVGSKSDVLGARLCSSGYSQGLLSLLVGHPHDR